GQIPERNHAGEVERADQGSHADRLPDHVLVNAARHVFGKIAHHHRGNAAGDLHILDGAAYLPARVVQYLAVLDGDAAGQRLELPPHEVFGLEEVLTTGGRGTPPPLGERGGRRTGGLIHLLRRRQWDGSDHLPRRWVMDVLP